MTVLATFLLAAVTSFAQQDPSAVPGQEGAVDASAKKPLLSPAEQASLHNKLVDLLSAESAFDDASAGKDRDKTSRARTKAAADFDAEWKKHEKKGNLLASMADLRAIFENCFEMKRPAFPPGSLRKETAKEDNVEFSFFLPKAYKAEKPCTTVVVLPGTAAADTKGTWAKPSDYFAATWEKTDATNEVIFQLCTMPAGLEFDPVPDLGRDADLDDEDRRIKEIWGGLGKLWSNYNVDRARLFLDCGRATCGFGLRFGSVFPDRFAGLILRDPTAVDDIRVGSLRGMPVLMLKTAANAAIVDALKTRLDEVAASVTVLDATDEYPHKASAAAITEWLGKQRRKMTPSTVVIEPNHDRFNKAYWVDIDRADQLLGAPPDARPRIEVTADRAANRITVKARGIESFSLFLNDDLVDLDKEFTVIVNDKAVSEKKTRLFSDMLQRMRVRLDWDYLFPVHYHSDVPKPSVEGGDKKQ